MNSRHLAPKASALPGCATPRKGWIIAVTGIAGPSGGTDEKPVGLVHLAKASRCGNVLHREMHYGDIGRDAVRLATVRTALDMLQDAAEG